MIHFSDRVVNEKALKHAVDRFRAQNIILPTFEQQRHPELIPKKIKQKLKNIGLWEINPLNLFRITWKNEPKEQGGLFGKPNYIELPSSFTGVKAKIVLLVGKYFLVIISPFNYKSHFIILIYYSIFSL